MEEKVVKSDDEENNQKFPSVANARQRYLNNLKLLIISKRT